jgi:uncharacterized protein (DUF58 family)
MIVPTPRLLVSYGLVVPPLALLVFLGQWDYAWALVGCSAFALVASVDCVLGFIRSGAVSVTLAPLARMTRGREGAIEVDAGGIRGSSTVVRLGLPFPVHILSSHISLTIRTPEKEPSLRVTWPCTPMRRGRFFIDGCHVETLSLLGLWVYRRRHDGRCEVRVYPDLAEEGRQLSALFLNHGGFGLHARRQQGKGREFERLRDYVPGDGYDEISWKATAKRRHPVTRLFQIERTQEVYVCVDTSRLSRRLWGKDAHGPSGGSESLLRDDHQTHLDRFIGASLILGLAARKQGDLFGMIAFDESVRAFLRASGNRSRYTAYRENLVSLNPRLVSPDFEELFSFIRLNLTRRCLIMLLTSLDDPLLAENFARAMELACHNHLVYVVMLRPEGARPIFSNTNVLSLDGVYDELCGHDEWRNLGELESVLKSRGVHLALVEKERLCVDLVSRYMDVKRRQLL